VLGIIIARIGLIAFGGVARGRCTESMSLRWHQRRGAGYAQRSSGNRANVAALWCIGIGGIAVMLVMDMLVARAL
jgi:hypothetical protein